MTRIVSYNILAGGYDLLNNNIKRTEQLLQMIRPVQPDIVGLLEAIHPAMKDGPRVIDELAEGLGMQLVEGGPAPRVRDYRLALLTRLPILSTKIHERPGRILRPVIEVCVEDENGQPLTVFVTHLAAAFNRGRGGGGVRMREVREVLDIMAEARASGQPHLLMGDFNSLAPREPFKGSNLIRYVVGIDTTKQQADLSDGNPNLNAVVPPRLRFLNPVLQLIAVHPTLGALFDLVATFYVPRGCIKLLLEAGYIDSYRRTHPHERGFTCPAAAPAGRIDYIFSSPTLIDRLSSCDVLTRGDGDLPGFLASDHFPLTAEYGVKVIPEPVAEEDDTIKI
ncbi:endonuclease/exonuclease/phosphatase family protein [Tengunoibacter tsumagoiensis]|uniref:Endonuclease/exonuclease/phosphatase domain-containing protein n=1 Tax=Tengunoibacter tsumagoiensis TaxID=2014871 RepID=A0A401ZWU1_9CHLR|nr:endonuclease/exonuclease/phosphatase family protein [Tengunoibacter tsumagoiensis]GCE11389.1 hypothetical protein KTT_12480 [Tengunoibacter tsumagoiensis]